MADESVSEASSAPVSGSDGADQTAPVPSIEDARAYFGNDRFATERCNIGIDEAAPGHAVCSFTIADHHRNALGNVMGGAIYTLADFALAIASNFAQQPSVTTTSSIEYLSGVRGSRLKATCTADKAGKRLGFYTTRVEDDLGNLVALVHATCLRVEDRASSGLHQ